MRVTERVRARASVSTSLSARVSGSDSFLFSCAISNLVRVGVRVRDGVRGRGSGKGLGVRGRVGLRDLEHELLVGNFLLLHLAHLRSSQKQSRKLSRSAKSRIVN